MGDWWSPSGVGDAQWVFLGKESWRTAPDDVVANGVAVPGPASAGVPVGKNHLGNMPSAQRLRPVRPRTFGAPQVLEDAADRIR